MRNTAVSNSDDVIDSRDIIARIDELEGLRDDAQEAKDGDPEIMEDGTEIYTSVDFQSEEYRELKALTSLADEAEGYAADWHHGEALIRDSYFTEYAQQLADDIGAVEKNASWPNNYIDWDAAAEALQQDYTSVDFDGVTYWIR